MFDNPVDIYVTVIALSGLVLVLAGNLIFRQIEKKRAHSIDKLKTSETIRTKTPLHKPVEKFKSLAKESISSRFTVIRWVFTASMVAAFLVALAYPFLNRLPKAFVSVLVAAAAVLVGIAARPILDNLVSGIVISTSHIVRIGDTVTLEGEYGTIEDVSPTHTTIKLWDWRRLVIPNSTIINTRFLNHTLREPWEWTHVEFWVSYEADLEKVGEIAKQGAQSSKHFSHAESPRFWLMDTKKEGVRCWIAAWAKSPAEAWLLRNDIRTHLAAEFRRQGVATHLHRMEGTGEQRRGDEEETARRGDAETPRH